jgi:hypothetical protein
MMGRRWLGILALVLALGLPGVADETAKPGTKKDDKQVVDSKAQKGSPARSINFSKELGLPFASLKTLGGRIDAARRTPDPVALGHAASELSVAEQVSGKKASLTSTALMKEATELAAMRRQQLELAALLRLNSQIASEQGTLTFIKEQIADAKRQAQQESEAVRRNEEPTSPRKLLVNNYTTQFAVIHVNGNYKMEVPPGESRWCTIEHKWNPTVLKASGDEDMSKWGPRYIWGTFKTYTWNLH